MDHRSVGMIGLGLLGSALAERFLRAGHAVVGFDIDPERRRLLASVGVRTTAAAVKVVREVGRVVLSRPTTDDVETVLDETANDMSTGTVILDTTTGDPDRRPAVGARLAASGVRYLDAAVVGSSELV